jgi:hypothetical protein
MVSKAGSHNQSRKIILTPGSKNYFARFTKQKLFGIHNRRQQLMETLSKLSRVHFTYTYKHLCSDKAILTDYIPQGTIATNKRFIVKKFQQNAGQKI